MIDNLAGDPRLLPAVRDIVRDLEPPLLRLALVDPRFFSDRSHPARQLLEQVTQRSLAWSSADDPGFATFMEGLQEATEALLDAGGSGPETYEIALSALQEAWDEAQPRARRNRERAVRALMRAEQRNLLAERLARQMLERPGRSRCAARGAGLPHRPVGAGDGAGAPGRQHRRRGSRGYGWVVQTVLWSVQPALSARVVGQQRALVERIDQGLASIDHLPADTTAGRTCCRRCATWRCPRPRAMPLRGADRESRPDKVSTWLAPLEMHETGFVADSALPLGAPSESGTLPPLKLEVGAFVDLQGRLGTMAAHPGCSPHGLLFMLRTRGGTTRSMTRRKLNSMLAQGSLRLVSAHPVVDGALDAVARAAWRNSSPLDRRGLLRLPHAVALVPQRDSQLHLHLAGGAVGHGVVDRVEIGPQPQPVVLHEAVRLDAGLVAVEAQVRIESGHAHVHEGHAEPVFGLQRRKRALFHTARPAPPRTRGSAGAIVRHG